ncbi:MAG: hypothetical protein SF123_02315, partial [Chloroflexota bacterium]|nr:hypothetical protein [Chloroflexota bacterium]
EKMKKWTLGLIAVGLLVLGVGTGVVAASDDINVPTINDGRVNSFDVATPVVVYCEFDHFSATDGTEWSALTQIDLYALLYSDATWENVVSVSADELMDAMAAEREDTVLLQGNYGFGLYLNTDDSLTVTAPPDFEGKTYSFTWTLGSSNC